MSKPLSPQYDGGIVVNPEINEELNGWTTMGDAVINHAQSNDGNKYIVASNRSASFSSFSQTFYLDKEKLYTFSGYYFRSFLTLIYLFLLIKDGHQFVIKFVKLSYIFLLDRILFVVDFVSLNLKCQYGRFRYGPRLLQNRKKVMIFNINNTF